MTEPSSPLRPIIVVGAGIIGLTSAVRIAETYDNPVIVVAEKFSGEGELSGDYASTTAGAHHLSFAADDDERQTRWDKFTYKYMSSELISLSPSQCGLLPLLQTEFYSSTPTPGANSSSKPTHLKILESHPEFVIRPAGQGEREDWPEGAEHSVQFMSLTMNPGKYLRSLEVKLKGELGVRFIQRRINHLRELQEPSFLPSATIAAPPAAIILCPGLNAHTLPPLLDPDVHPIRGQVLLIRAPWVTGGFTFQQGELGGAEGGERTYIIPREGGEVVLGGTRDLGEWDTTPSPSTTLSILTRCLALHPGLLPSTPPTPSSHPPPNLYLIPETPQDLIDALKSHPLYPYMLSTHCGLRPNRTGGPRLEKLSGGLSALLGEELGGDEAEENGCEVICNYGHGGAGWQACWGAAEDVVRLMEGVEGARRRGAGVQSQ